LERFYPRNNTPNFEVKFNVIIDMLKEVTQFGSGRSFGEKAIEENKPRSATVYVRSEEIVVATLTRNNYLKVIGDSYKT